MLRKGRSSRGPVHSEALYRFPTAAVFAWQGFGCGAITLADGARHASTERAAGTTVSRRSQIKQAKHANVYHGRKSTTQAPRGRCHPRRGSSNARGGQEVARAHPPLGAIPCKHGLWSTLSSAQGQTGRACSAQLALCAAPGGQNCPVGSTPAARAHINACAQQRAQCRRVALGNVASVLSSSSRCVVQLLAHLLRTLYYLPI